LWKINTNIAGIRSLFKQYQYKIILKILDLKKGTHITSGEMHDFLTDEGLDISRASVINYLQELDKNGIVSMKEATGKGGVQRRYSPLLTFEQIIERITTDTLKTLHSAFPKSDYLKYLQK
jgi:predicted transcriptional regulator